jgi:hypothetical protein
MNRSDILKEAERIITQDRAATHGNAEDSFAMIGKMWGAYLGINVLPHDVAMLMVLFKAVRFRGNPTNSENALDAVGYSALAGEIATKPAEPATPHPDVGDMLSPASQSAQNKRATLNKHLAL